MPGEETDQAEVKVTPVQETTPPSQYDLHVMLSEEMRPMLKDAAELAYLMGSIPKADLVNLVNLFINWGMIVLKQQYENRRGYNKPQ